MRMVSIFELRNNLADHLAAVAETDTPLVVGKFGKPIAVITPYTHEAVSYKPYFGFLKRDERGDAYLRRVRRSKRERSAIAKRRGGV